MRELIYPHCVRCSCPLVRMHGEARYRILCIRCHEDMATHSKRNPNACRCAQVVVCKACRQREHKFAYVQAQKQFQPEYFREYHQDYYYRHWEAMCAKRRELQRRLRRTERESK